MHTEGPLHIHGPSTGNGPYDDGGDYAIYRLNEDDEREIIGEAFRLVAQDTEAPARSNAQLWTVAPDLLTALIPFANEATLYLLEDVTYRCACCNAAPQNVSASDFEHRDDCPVTAARSIVAAARGE